MRTRVVTAVVSLFILFPFLFFSDTFMLEIFVAVLATVALGEMLNCMGLAKRPEIFIPAYLISLGVPFAIRRIEAFAPLFSFLCAVFFIFMFYLMILAVISKGGFSINDAATVFMMSVYVVLSFSCIILLRDIKYGQYVFLLVFMSAWMTDTGAYICGITFGRHKLIEDVSPKKTVEGAVGGVIFCVASFCIYGFVIGFIFDATPRYIPLIIIGAVMSVISQCGDLIASLIKRHYNIKDYGKVFPGHGGVMDRFDSIIATAPFLFLLYSFSSFFELFF